MNALYQRKIRLALVAAMTTELERIEQTLYKIGGLEMANYFGLNRAS